MFFSNLYLTSLFFSTLFWYAHSQPSSFFPGCQVEKFKLKKCKRISFHVWEIADSNLHCPYWGLLFDFKDAIFFVVDTSDYERVDQARELLHMMLSNMRNQDSSSYAWLPLLIIGTKRVSVLRPLTGQFYYANF